MSLLPKIAEVFKFTVRNKVDLACINETWLKDRIVDSVEEIPGYSIIRRDREVVEHGGVYLYIKDRYSKYRLIDELKCCEEHEILWVHPRPKRLPRGYSCLAMAIVYHPDPSAENDSSTRNHLSSSLALAESIYPNCALMVCGNFNRLNLQLVKNHYHLKQIVKVPSCSLLPHLDINELESLPMHEVADHINHALLEPLEEYRLTDEIPKIPLEEDHAPEFLVQETLSSQSCKGRRPRWDS